MIKSDGWNQVSLEELAEEVCERIDNPSISKYDKFVGLEHFISGDLRIKQWGETRNLVSAMKEFRKGDILFARRNAYLKRASLVDFDGVCSGDAIVVREKKEKITSSFLALLFNSESLWHFANSHAAGTMSKRVKWRDLSKYSFKLPSLEEQKRIAELLWSIYEAIDRFHKTIEVLREYRNIYVSQITQKRDSKKWPVVSLVSCFDIVSGQVDPKEEPYHSMPLIAPNHIEQRTGHLINIETAGEQDAISGKYLFKSGDVLYSKIRPNLQKAIIADFDGLCSADMYAFSPKVEKIKPGYLLAIMLSEEFTKFALTRCVRTGIPKLNRQELSEYEISLPSLKEQEVICAFLEQISYCEQGISLHITKMRKIMQSLFNDLFGGSCV